MRNSFKFEQEDFGAKANIRVYGQKTPPEIDIRQISEVPIGIWSGAEDNIADVADVAWIVGNLKTLKFNRMIYHHDHSSFLMGLDMSYLTEVADLVG